MKHLRALAAGISCLCLADLEAAPFQVFRIGDVDGFGYGAATGLKNEGGTAADANGSGRLDDGDQLPDLNQSGDVATGSRDDFDNRLGESFNGSGFSLGALHGGSKGLDYTDIALSTSYQNSQGANQVYNHNTLSYGAGGAFPEASDNAPNQPGFVFDFTVPVGQIDPLESIFFNLVYADYDVTPASVKLTYSNGSFDTINVNVQPPNKDGLIQSASQLIDFGKVFTQNGGSGKAT